MTNHRVSVPLWTGYTAAFLIASFFSVGIFSRFPLMGSVPNILPVVIAFTAVLEGSFGGSIYGLSLGLLSCLAQGGREISMILWGAVIGMLAGLWQRRKLRKPMLPCLCAAFLALLGVNLLRVGYHLVLHYGSLATLMRIAGYEVAYSMALALPLYPLFLFIHRRLGNT